MRKSLFQAALFAALLGSASAQAQQAQQCMSRAEVHGMVGYFLPVVLDSTLKTCGVQASSNSFFKTRAPSLLSELNASREGSWPMARAAFVKFAGGKDELSKLPDNVVRPMIDAVVAQKLGEEINGKNCSDVDRVMAPMAPLPAANVADLVTEIFMVAMRKDKKLPTCA